MYTIGLDRFWISIEFRANENFGFQVLTRIYTYILLNEVDTKLGSPLHKGIVILQMLYRNGMALESTRRWQKFFTSLIPLECVITRTNFCMHA